MRKDLENKLRTLSYKDSLTGVTNRRYFFELASLEIARSRRSHDPLSVVEFDIDHFKQINDTHGHAVGDEVLNAVCARCQQLLRKTDVLARMGGEEFVVLLPDASLEEATQLAERLRQAIADSAMSPVAGYPGCTVSIGVTLLDAADTSIEDCLLRADRAMYQAKQDGRNRVKIET